jgi:hypothetical protein
LLRHIDDAERAVCDHQAHVREELKIANFVDSFREYLKVRGESKEGPFVPEACRAAS